MLPILASLFQGKLSKLKLRPNDGFLMKESVHADNTCVIEYLIDLTTNLSNELENISNWMRKNKLSFNASNS